MPHKRAVPDHAELRRLYVECRLSTAKIGKRYTVRPRTIQQLLREYNIPMRWVGGKNTIRPERSELAGLYLEQQLNCPEIARRYGVSQPTVLKWLKFYDIPRRPPGTWSLAHTIPLDVRNLTETQRAYLAAFIDGEGSVVLRKRVNPNGRVYLAPQLDVCNTHRPTIEALSEMLTGSRMYVAPVDKRNHRTRPLYKLSICGIPKVLALLESVRPYMITKAEQADAVIGFCKQRLAIMYDRSALPTETEWRAFEQVTTLNSGGRALAKHQTH